MGGDGPTICNRNSVSGQVAQEDGDDSYSPTAEMKEQSCFCRKNLSRVLLLTLKELPAVGPGCSSGQG